MSDAPPLAVIATYQDLIMACQIRAAQRHIALSGEANQVAGFPDQYIAKLIGAKPVRRIGMMSLGPLLGVLGVKLTMIEDVDAIKRYGDRIKRRDERLVRSAVFHVQKTTRRFYQKIGKVGGQHRVDNLSRGEIIESVKNAARVRWSKMTPKQRSEHGRDLVRIRWAKRRKRKTRTRRSARQSSRQAAANRGARS